MVQEPESGVRGGPSWADGPLLPPPPPAAPPPPPGPGLPATFWSYRGAPGPDGRWGVPAAKTVRLVAGRRPVQAATVAAAIAAAFLGSSLVLGTRWLEDLPLGVAGTPGDRGLLLPVLALVTVAATMAALWAGRRWLRSARVVAGGGSAGSLLGAVASPSLAFQRGLPGARRTFAAAVALATCGSVLVAVGAVIRGTAASAQVATAGTLTAVAGAVAILLAAGLVPAILRAVERREVAVACGRGEWPLVVPGARSPLPGLLAMALLSGYLLAPIGSREPVSTDCALDMPWRCDTVGVRADQLTAEPYADVIRVAYAVHPATDLRGRPPRVLVIATGGPGSSGIEDGEWMLDWLDPRITERFDVVTFDARGTGRTDPRDCPRAAREYDTELITEEAARDFAAGCVEEAGAGGIDLGRYATDQVVEDIEAIRVALGAERISLFGTSYGTVVGQAYGVAHPGSLDALVLDAPVDRTLPAAEQWVVAARGFEASIVATLATCPDDPDCRAALPDARRAYEDVLDRLDRTDRIEASIVGSDGVPRNRSMSAAAFDDLTYGAMYGTTTRMSWLRALSGARIGDDRPLLRLYDAWSGPGGGSSFAYYATWCADASVGSADRPGDVAAFMDVADAAGLEEGVAIEVAHTLAPCLFWPGAQDAPVTRPVPVDVPTLILGSTADPVTPIAGARTLLERLPGARLVETRGGAHGSLGEECPNARIAEFLVDGRLPVARSSVCAGWVADSFVPLAPSPAWSADDAAEGLAWELLADPEVLAWDGTGSLRIGCAGAGSARFEGVTDGWRSKVALDGCSWAERATFDGTGWIDLATWDLDLTVTSSRGDLHLRTIGSTWRLTGRWDGAIIDEDD